MNPTRPEIEGGSIIIGRNISQSAIRPRFGSQMSGFVLGFGAEGISSLAS